MANAPQPRDGLASGPHGEAVGLVERAFWSGRTRTAGDRDQALALEKGLGIAHNAFGWC